MRVLFMNEPLVVKGSVFWVISVNLFADLEFTLLLLCFLLWIICILSILEELMEFSRFEGGRDLADESFWQILNRDSIAIILLYYIYY